MKNKPLISTWHSRVVMISGSMAFCLGAFVLTGWYIRNTALGFLLCGLGLFSLAFGKTRLSALSGAVAGTIGVMTLIGTSAVSIWALISS